MASVMNSAEVQAASNQHTEIAQAAAAYAGTAYFSSRRGVLPSDADIVVIYDNHPYANYPNLRDQELAELKKVMEDKYGIKCLAEAAYPATGEQQNYSVAIVFDRTDADLVVLEWKSILRRPNKFVEAAQQ